MTVEQHTPHFTVNYWKTIHMWVCSWTWSSSYFLVPWFLQQVSWFLQQVWTWHTCSRWTWMSWTPPAVPLLPPQESLSDFFFLHFFFFMILKDPSCHNISLPSCWLWSFLELGKGSCMEMGATADTVTVASSCHISIHHSSRQCPPVLG